MVDDMLPPNVLTLRVFDIRSTMSLAQCGCSSDMDTVGCAKVGDTAVVVMLILVSTPVAEMFVC